MICMNCQEGAAVLACAADVDHPETRDLARAFHRECPGNTHCYCQHRVPVTVGEKAQVITAELDEDENDEF